MEEDYEFKREIVIAYVKKNYGISPPTEADEDEKFFQEQLSKNPALRQTLRSTLTRLSNCS